MSEKEHANVLRRMAGNIASGLVRSRRYEQGLLTNPDNVEYDSIIGEIALISVHLAEEIYDLVEGRVKPEGETP